MTTDADARVSRAAWGVWAIALMAYGLSVFHRASFGVAGIAAQERFGVTAAVLSILSVLQLAVYAGLQIPVGALLDRLGSRRMIVAGATVAGLGQVLLATAESVGPAIAARVLVGGGDAMIFTSVLRLVALWFPPRRVPVMSQLTGIVGQAGQIAAAYPLVALLEGAGWTPAYLGAGITGLVVAALVAAWLRDAPAGASLPPAPAGAEVVVGRLRDAWREPGTRLGLWTHFVTQFPATVFSLLWGYPFLVAGQGRTPAEAGALLTLLVVAGMAVGPVLGLLAGRWPYRRSIPVLAIVAATAGMWGVVLAWPGRAPLALLVLLVLVMASNGPASMMGFDYARTENPPTRIGSATGIVNLGGFTASLLTILLVGLVLDARGGGGPGAYTLDDFRLAMAVQYLFWAIGVAGVIHQRRRLRAARAVELDAFPAAVVRVTRRRLRRRRADGI